MIRWPFVLRSTHEAQLHATQDHLEGLIVEARREGAERRKSDLEDYVGSLAAAIAQEREACAVLAERAAAKGRAVDMQREIAKRIRTRPAPNVSHRELTEAP